MKKMVKILCSFVCLLSLVALVLTSCDFGGFMQNILPDAGTTEGDSPAVTTPSESKPSETTPSETTTPNNNPPVDPLGKQIPVYQGMSISSSTGVSMPSFEKEGNNGNGNTNNNGNHHGWYKGDSADNQGDVDQNTPFPDADGNIEEEIKDSLEVIGSKQDIYYAAQNQDVYIHIYIDNPDKFEILSFTLNGEKYSSYMFEYGSNMEVLILKYNVGDVSGIVEYTIDQIKYIDGTEIKDVKIGGDKTVKAGIRTEDQVTATVTNLQIGTNSVSFNATIVDKDGLIAYSQGNVKAVLYDGDTLVAEKELIVGSNAVAFEGLTTGSVYQYAVVASYDAFTGDGIGLHVLGKYAFQTNHVVLFDNIVIGQENISFAFVWDASVTNKALSGLKLYKGGALVKELSADATTVSDLLSANEYTLVAEYRNLGKTETISLTFTTFEKTPPQISIISPTQTQTSVGFEISKTDTDNVGAITKIELVHTNGTVVADNVDIRSFADLLSNNTHTVKVTYTYDLNDGNGEQTLTAEANITTLAKAAPQFVISNEKATSGNITADYTFTDVDSTLASYKVELYNGEILVAQNDENKISFTGLEYFIDYTITITYTYDLNDGKGVQTATATKSAKMVSSGLAYTVNDDGKTCTITGMGTCTDTTVVIPDVIDGYTVTAIGENAFADNSTIASFMIPNTVDTIGTRAFYKCTGITEITIPESVWEIGTQIFQGCSNLTTVYYNGRYGNQENPFLNTQSIETVVFGGKEVPSYVAYGATNIKTVVILDGVASIDFSAFYGCSNLENVTIPDSVTSIWGCAFEGCSNLVSIILPADITKISGGVFSGCGALKNINIPNGVIEFESDAFRECSSLANITLPNGLKSIGNAAFYGCSNLTNLTIPDSVTYIDGNAFWGCSNLTSIVIPSSITEISYCLFLDCCNLTSITIPDSVTSIGFSAFWGCSSLTSITIPDGVTSIGSSAFSGCTSLTSITIPYGNTIIDGTFYGCKNLTSIAIPDSVTSIGDLSFYDCFNLKSIKIPDGVTSIGSSAFHNCNSLTSITFQGTVDQWNAISKDEYWDLGSDNYAVYCTDGILCKNHNYESTVITEPTATENGLAEYTCSVCGDFYTETIIPKNFEVNQSNLDKIGYTGEFGENLVIPAVFQYKGTWYRVTDFAGSVFHSCTGLSSITIPYGITSLDYGLFYDCNNLTSIVIPDTVTSIGNYAFSGCSSLTSITIPDSVTSIGDDAFFSCSSLTSITIPNSVISIGNYAFQYCTALTSITIPEGVTNIGDGVFYGCLALTSVNIPNGITSISSQLFLGCNSLTTITIPNSVTCIGTWAFNDCNALTNITFEGTIEQWGAIEFEYDMGNYIIAKQIHCSNGDFCFAHNYESEVTTAPTATATGVIKYTCSVCGDSYTEPLIPADFIITAENRTWIGYTGEKGENLVIPAVFEYNGTWYKVTSIGDLAFRNCGVLTSVTIPDGVTSIGNNAFEYCGSLTSITLPNSITSIGDYAFNGSSISVNITFGGTITQWRAISIGTDWKTVLPWDAYETEHITFNIICSDGVLCLEEHTEVIDEAVSPTCTETGLTEGKHCSVCDEFRIAQTTVDALGHTEVIDEAVAPTFTEAGFSEGKHCSVCETVIIVQEVILSGSRYGYHDFANQANGDAMQTLYYDLYCICEEFLNNTQNINAVDGLYILSTIDVSGYSLTIDEAVAVWKVFYMENPKYYWLSNTITAVGASLTLCIDEAYATAEYRALCDAAVEEMVDECYEIITLDLSALEKAIAIHDFILGYMEYAYESDGVTPEDDIWAHNMVGCAKYNLGVCESYAKTYLYLCLLNNIDCIIVTGDAGEDHAWNMICLDGVWYAVDCTWDDTNESGLTYDYFGMSGAYMEPTHTADTPETVGIDYWFALPKLSERSLELVYLYEGDTLLGTFGNIDMAFEAMTNTAGDYTIKLYEYTYTGYVDTDTGIGYAGVWVIEHRIYSSELPAVGSLTIVGHMRDLGLGVSTHPPVVLKSNLYANSNIIIENLGLYNHNEDTLYIKDYSVTTRGYYCLFGVAVFGDELSEIIAETEHQTDFHASVNIHKLNTTSACVLLRNASQIDIVSGDCINIFYAYAEINIGHLYGNLAIRGNAQVYIGKISAPIDVSASIVVHFDDVETFESLTIGAIDCPVQLHLRGETPFDITKPIAVLERVADFEKIQVYYAHRSGLIIDGTNLYRLTDSGEIKSKDFTRLDGLIIIDNCVVSYDGEDTMVIIPDGITEIADYAFSRCSSLTSIMIPDSVTYIGSYAFYECTSLSWVVIPDSVKTISSYAFYYCNCLDIVYFGAEGSVLILDGIGIDNTDLTTASRYYYRETQPADTTYEYWHYVDGIPTLW